MPTLRALRLLNSVESGTTSGSVFNTYLTDAGRLAEFNVLLSMRGTTRRIASNATTMSAFGLSPLAINAIFGQASVSNSTASLAVTASATAMILIGTNLAVLNAVNVNPITWAQFIASAYYTTNAKNIIATYAGVTPTSYASADALILDPSSMAAIVASAHGMAALVANPASVATMAGNSPAMAVVAANSLAIAVVAANTATMPTIANSSAAMTEINSRSAAVAIISAQSGAVIAISNSTAGWASFMAGSYFATNLPTILANLIGVSTTTYPTLNSIIADATALTKVAASKSACQALASNSAALTTLSTSSNLGIILGSYIAMGVIGPNTSAMTSFINSSGAWSGLFASSVAKGYIVTSTPLVDAVAANSALLTYLNTIAVKNVAATGIPDGNATALQAFITVPALPAKLLTLAAKEVGIAATYSNYNFGGSSMAGTQAGATLSLSGTGVGGQPVTVAGYTGMMWNLQAIGVTAATLPIITYVDMT